MTVTPRTIALNAGTAETRNLAECLAIDQGALALAVLPGLGLAPATETVARVAGQGRELGISRQMAAIGAALSDALADMPDRDAIVAAMAGHPSDTVRSWAAFVVGRSADGMGLAERLGTVRRFAADTHFGVREWAWLAVRPYIAADVVEAIRCLKLWTSDPDANVRRFAVEGTRPRGVWCEHIRQLKEEPWLAESLLVPLRADPARYVQDSVANWLNDASKSQPDWVVQLCERWSAEADRHTQRIVERALRTVRKGGRRG